MSDQIILQGDLAFIPVPENLRNRLSSTANMYGLWNYRRSNVVLARGEKTGHAHVTDDNLVDVVLSGWPTRNGPQAIIVTHEEPVEVRHEEHGTVILPPLTMFEVRRQREYVPPAPETNDPPRARFVLD